MTHHPQLRIVLTAAAVCLLPLACNSTEGGSGNGRSPAGSLVGDPGDSAAEAVPEVDFEPRPEDYSDDHPELPGVSISYNTMALVFTLETTVAEANGILEEIEGEVVGGLAGVADEAEGIVLVRVPTTNHQEMIDLVATLERNENVLYAVPDILLEAQMSPVPNGGAPADWTWEATPGGGNWGLELIRAPQMWNLNAAVEAGGVSAATAILDAGFAETHLDLSYAANLTPTSQNDHGTQVAGIIAADFENGTGVEGLNPYAELIVQASFPVCPPTTPFLTCVQVSAGQQLVHDYANLVKNYPSMRVVNTSLGYNWAKPPSNVDSDTNAAAQATANGHGNLVRVTQAALVAAGHNLPVVVVSAGNDSGKDAMYNSPFCNAALKLGVKNIIVVEAVDLSPTSTGGATLRATSNIKGHLSAPGQDILSTTLTSYGPLSGTSAAAPFVAGLVGYMYAVAPTLPSPTQTDNPVLDLLEINSLSVGGGAQDRIDAFGTVLDIDTYLGGDSILRKLLDIDDGTPDGNQRVDPTTGADLSIGTAGGDGAIDMSDFRRWRDWLLQVEGAGAALDGAADHPKKDVNGNGSVETPALENVYPRGDFNGDGQLSRTETELVPGAVDADVTDLAVLQLAFSDPDYNAAELTDLIDSGDLEIRPESCFLVFGVENVISSIKATGSAEVLDMRTHTSGNLGEIYTLPVNAAGYTAKVEAFDGAGNLLESAEETFTFTAGSDRFWDAVQCAPIDLDVTFPEKIPSGEATTLSIRAGIVDAVGNVDYSEALQIQINVSGGQVAEPSGFTDGEGNYETTATLGETNPLLLLTIIATIPGGASVIKMVEAKPTTRPIALISRSSTLYATAVFIEDGTNGQTVNLPFSGFGPFVDTATATDGSTRGVSTQDSFVNDDPDLGFTGATAIGTASAKNSGEGVGSAFAIRAEARSEFRLTFSIPVGSFYEYTAVGSLSLNGDRKYSVAIYRGPTDFSDAGNTVELNAETGASAVISDTGVLGSGSYGVFLTVFNAVALEDTGLTADGSFDFQIVLVATEEP